MRELMPFPMKPGSVPGGTGGASQQLTRIDEGAGGAAAAPPEWRPTLEVLRGTSSRRSLPLGAGPARVGRASGNDLVLSDEGTSRNHAEVRYEDGSWVLEDLGSSNGSQVDGAKVGKAPLRPGARITLGQATLEFRQPVPDVPEEERLALMGRSDLLETLDAGARAAAAAGMKVRFVPKGGVLLRQGAPMEGILFVHLGCLRVVEVNEEGGERLVAWLTPGTHFGERALVSGAAAPQSLVADVDSCVLALTKAQLGATLQVQPDRGRSMTGAVRRKIRSAVLRVPVRDRRDDLDDLVTSTDVEIVGEDRKVVKAREKVEAFAKDALPVLVVGPQGAGKRAFARWCHRSGPGTELPYVEMSVADPGPDGAATAIFGSEAQPGGAGEKIGFLEMIGEGTLAIAHAELLDAHLQSLLASYLKLGWFHRVNGREAVSAKTRLLLLATGDEASVTERLVPELRELLAPRTVVVPPLTQRLKDIPLLAEHFLRKHAARAGRKAPALSREATERLVSAPWPGNVRELDSVMQRAAIVGSEDSIIPVDLIFVAPPEKEVHKLNLLRDDRVRTFLRRPTLMPALVRACIAFVLAVLLVTLWGGTRPAGHPLKEFATNPGMLVTWVVWFPLLPLSAFLLGRAWCGVCPIAGFGDLAGKVKRYNLPVPKLLKRLDFWLVAASFVLVDWVEELFGVADEPLATAVFLIVLLYLAFAMTVFWERKAFCRHLCPLGGVLGAYSTMSVLEVRGNKKVCQTQCGEHTCYKGSEKAPGCPLFSYPASINTNAECMMCLNCLKSCENRGVQLNLRPPLQEVWRNGQPTLALSLFGVALVGMMVKHQFPDLTSWIPVQQRLGWTEGWSHTILYFGFILLALGAFLVASALSAAASRERLAANMAAYGVAFIPLAFSGHMAHLAHEVLTEKLYLLLAYVVKLYDSVLRGVPIAGSTVEVAPFVPSAVVTFLKLLLVAGGMTGTLVALVMIARRISREYVLARVLPHLFLAVVVAAAYFAVFTGSTGAPAPAGAPVAAVAPAAATAGGPGGVPALR